MANNPYKHFPDTQFWSSGFKKAVSAQSSLTIDPILKCLTPGDSFVSGGSCFAQYIGVELTDRGFDYLRSELSGDRIESFGLGNIYTIAQWKQWLEFSLEQRVWGEYCEFEKNGEWYDMLLPHRAAMSSKDQLLKHRDAVKNEILSYLKNTNVLIFTIGLTETWRNQSGDIYPSCPGTLVGEYDESIHSFHNCTFNEIHKDLEVIDRLLSLINSEIRIIYTVSPVPLTATATDTHVLLATTYSKSVIRAAIGEFCLESPRSTYFPSYELISHHTDSDWRYQENLRSISDQGVRYVMGHAFGEDITLSGSKTCTENIQTLDSSIDIACEEELLESHAKLAGLAPSNSTTVLAGDCHMEKLGSGFKASGIDVIGGIIMHGSSFTDYKFELSADRILLPLDSQESVDLWMNLHDQLLALNGDCNIITNIGFHTHRTINIIANHFRTYVITQQNIADYFEQYYHPQIHILRELTKLGKVWMVEDPSFHAFVGDKNNAQLVRDKNFLQYCNYMRLMAHNLDIEYLNPCDTALQRAIQDGISLNELIEADGFLGKKTYYEYCALVVNEAIGNDCESLAHAA